ncbi:MAG: T9SS type A sorting domain-containing protein [Paludibacteraceae bacterium]|nr:T9SS type A sorting domain-containing protein [Paludibacteraceae bacterium]
MKHLLLLLALMLQTVSFAFDKESAIDFVYEYSGDSLWGIPMPEGYDYTVGIIERDIDTLYNSWDVYEGEDSVETKVDTILVPKDNYVFFVTVPDNFIFKGQSKFLSYLFLSKNDSSFVVIDTVGYPERFCCWDTIREEGRVLKKEAIYDVPKMIDSKFGTIDYNLYLVEDTSNMKLYKLSGETVVINKKSWNFIVETQKDTCYIIKYWKDKEYGIIVDFVPVPIVCNTDWSNEKGLSLVFSRQNGDVKEYGSVKEYMVYPNPVSDIINVDIDNCSLSLFSNEGKLIKRAEEPQMNISELPSGTYLLEISKEGKSIVKKIIKH